MEALKTRLGRLGGALNGRRSIVAAGLLCMIAAPGTAAYAQELTHRFLNPAFGGNSFNYDHLMGTAQIHRPVAPTDATGRLTEQQLLVRQIQSRLLSSLSQGLIEAVTGAAPGTSGEFTIGDQVITYERTLTEIRLVFFNTTTGETTEIILPVINNPTGNPTSASSMAVYSPETTLGSGIPGGPQPGNGLASMPPLTGTGSSLLSSGSTGRAGPGPIIPPITSRGY